MKGLFLVVIAVAGGCRDLRERATPERDGGPKLEQTEEVFPEPPPPAGPVGLAAGRYRIVRVGATVARRTRSGIAWDLLGGAAADPKLEVEVGGEVIARCTGGIDAPSVICPVGQELDVRGHTTITLTVVDDDLAGDERIGEATASRLLETGRAGVRMKLAVREQVTSAFVELVKVKEPPGAWARNRWRFLGTGGGALLGLLAMLIFRRGLFRTVPVTAALPVSSDPPPELGWACSHCHTRNGPGGLTCFHCGARR